MKIFWVKYLPQKWFLATPSPTVSRVWLPTMPGSSTSKKQHVIRSCFPGLGTPSLSAGGVPGKPPLFILGHWNTLVTEPGSLWGICFNFLCFWLEYGSRPKRVTVTGTRNHCWRHCFLGITMPRLWKLNLKRNRRAEISQNGDISS